MVNTFVVNFSKMPFKKPDKHLFNEGSAISDVIAGLPVVKGMSVVVSVNGAIIPEEKYSETRPLSSDVVVVANAPQGTTAIIVASVIIGLLVGYALYKLTPKPEDDDGKEFKELSSITGIRNEQKRYKPVSLVLGKRVVAPAYAALPYTEIVGEDEYFNILLCVGYGPLRLRNIKIGDTLLSDFPSDEYSVALYDHYENTSIVPIKRLWPASVVQEGVTYELTKENKSTRDYKVHTLPGIGEEYTQASQDFFFPSGIYRINSEGKYRQRTVGVRHEVEIGNKFYCVAEVKNSLTNDPEFKYDDGVVYRSLDGTLRVNITPTSGGSRVAYTISSSDVIYENNINTDKVMFFKPTGVTALPALSNIASFTISGNSPRQRRRAIKYFLPTGYTGLTRSAKLYPTDTPDSSKEIDTVNWINIRSIKEETTQSFRNALYLNDPIIKPVYMALRIKATDNFTSMLDNVNVEATQCVPDNWNIDWSTWATSGATLVPTENPADAYRWVLQGPANVSRLPTNRLDLNNLLEWKNFCDNQTPHESFRISHEVDTEYTLLKLLSITASSGRAEFGFVDGKYGVVIKKNQQYPVQVFTPKNSWDFSAARVYPEVVDGVKVEFENEAADYQKDEVIYYDSRIDVSERNGKYTGITYKNVPSSSLALRHGRFNLLETALRREIFKLTVDAEGLVAKRGMKVLVQNDVIDVGLGAGRIRHISDDRTTFYIDEVSDLEEFIRATLDNDQLLLDSLITLDADPIAENYGGSYGIVFRNLNGEVSDTTRCEYFGDGKWVISEGVVDASLSVGDFVSYGELGNEVIECVVDAIDYKEDYSCELTLLNFADELYTYDGDGVPDYETGLNTRPEFKVPDAPVLSSYSFDPSKSQINIKVNYELTYDFSIKGISIYVRSVGDDETFDGVYTGINDGWQCVDIISEGDNDFIVPNVFRGENYQFRSRISNSDNVVSKYSNIIETGVISVSIPPSDVTGLTNTVSKSGVVLNWNKVNDPDFSNYEVRRFDGVNETVVGATISEIFDLGYVVSGEYRVYAKTSYGVYSASPAITNVQLQQLGVVSNLKGTVNFGTVSIDWDEPANSIYPISYYEVRKVLPNKENTWEAADIVGRVSGSFTLVAEKTSGIYHYKVMAVDAAGRQSLIADTRVTVDRAGDFVLLVDENIDLTDLSDVTSENVAISGGSIYAPVYPERTLQDRADRISSEDTGGSVPSSDVTIQDKIDAGWVYVSQPVPDSENDYTDPSAGVTPSYYERVIDLFNGYVDSDGSNLIGGTRVSVGLDTTDVSEGVVIKTYLASSADTVSWEEASEGVEDFFSEFRYVRVRLYFDTPLNDRKSQIIVNSINVRLDVQKKTEEGVAKVNPDPITGETVVQLTREFIDVESVVVTVEGSGSSNYYAVSIFTDIPNPNEFSFKVFDNDGNLVLTDTVIVSYIVRGV